MKTIIKLIKKYQTFLKYILVAILSFLIDIGIFSLLNSFLNFNKKIIVATIIARVVSSFINYLLNKNKVFESNEGKIKTIFKYYLLVIIQMFVSAFSVDFLYSLLKINATIIKIPVEFIIFICNYLIQKYIIFKK